MKNLILTTLLLVTASTNTFAAKFDHTPEAACSPLDFRTEFPMPIRDQGGVSWCYGNAAADYLQYTYRLPQQISAADIAISYSTTFASGAITFFKRIFSNESRMEPPQTGFIDLAVKHMQSRGYCPESVLPSTEWPRSSKDGQTKVRLLQAIMDLYSLQAEVQAGVIGSASELPWFYNLKNMNQDLFFTLLRDNTQNKLLPAIDSVVCQNDRHDYPAYPIKRRFSIRSKHIFQNINNSFNNDMPSTIDFFSDVYDNYDHPKKRLADLHTVLLYGRKFDPVAKECTYILRDSHGTNCSQYDPKIPCDGGFLTFPESKLYDVMTSSLTIERL